MNSKLIQIKRIPSLLVLFLAGQVWTASSQTTAFNVQGRLTDSGLSANGNYEMRFSTYAGSSGGSAISTFIPPSPISVADGLFNSTVDFGGGVFTGPDRWLQIEVRPAGTNTYTLLSNRVLLSSSPYTIRSLEAAALSAGSLTASQIQVAGGPPSAGKVLGFDGTSMIWTTAGGGTGYWSQNGSSVYYNGGNVGIGVNAPAANLHIYDPANSVSDLIETGGGINAWAKVQFKNLNGQWDIGTSRGFVGDVFYIDRIGTPELEFALAPSGNLGLSAAPANDTRLTLFTTPNTPFAVPHYGIEHTDGNVRLATFLTLNTAGLGTRSNHPLNFFVNDGSASMTIDTLGRVGIGTSSPQATLDVRGSMRTSVLTITGGADIAEPFELSAEEIQPGSVVAIDEEHPGQLRLSDRAYDTRVAGVVSGANGVRPGLSLHQEGTLEGGKNVALNGRVYVQTDASYGAIKPGDLLTTSDTPGYAMKVTDAARAQGAILGKAMGNLNKGKGLVLVLVTLE